MLKGRTTLAAGVIIAVFAVVFGFSSSPASAGSLARTKLVITSRTPASPTAGQTYTMTFQLQKAGLPLGLVGVGCYATAGGRLAPLLYQGTDGTTGTCSWSVPSTAIGKTLDGIIAVQRDTGTWFYRGFDLSIS
jgi:hypothetical protein